MSRPPTISRAVDRGLSPFRGRRAAHLLPKARLGGPIPWVLAIMVAVTVIAAGGALALSNLTATARGELSGSATIQIIEADPALRDRQARQVAEKLDDDPAIAALRIVPPEETAQLLEPWLGGGEGMEVVPIPALIDLELQPNADDQALDRIRGTLADTVPRARIDAQETWLAPVLNALASLRLLAFALMLLLGLVGGSAVWLAARNALGSNRDTIEIVHLLGGDDNQIARVFQRSMLIDAAIGGMAGLILGVLALLFLGARFAALDSGMVAGGTLQLIDWALLMLVPLFAVAIAVYTARMTVLSSLRRML